MRGKLVGWAGTILPCCWRRSNCCASAALLNSPQAPFPTHLSYLLAGLVPGWSERSPDAPSKPTMLTERHFEKFVVKSVFGEVCSDCRRDIINEHAIEDRCFGSKRLQALCRTGNGRAWMYAAVWSETRRVGVVAARMEGKQTAGSAHQADQSMTLCRTKLHETAWHQITFAVPERPFFIFRTLHFDCLGVGC